MLNLKQLVSYFCLFVIFQTANAQLGFSHEIGVIAGPVQFRSDYGSRNEGETNFGNSGIGIGIVHFFNFSYRKNYHYSFRETYFIEHFKIRNEISWNRTKLEHFGKWVDPSKTSEDAKRLRGHTGVSKNIDLGTQLEFFPLNIHAFESFTPKVAPFISLGIHYTLFNAEVNTTYANPNPLAIGDLTDPSNFYSLWNPGSVDASSGSTWSVVSSVGVRYKLSKLADLMLDVRGQYYFSDWVDGLNHQLEYNKNNDWLVWVNIGYIYYLD
ncbi:hypothetical protein SAMN05428642_101610 [Flaviramulus basaltis]|uniref:Glutamate dehydrogenase n=1 Tax=Flaviramulus basaltis TaxID=369401 RepID=A0A1K2IC66_9FLAO|nr:glutamate dehydrogenase [Flaviramulus basaltis]SFZ89872.1 hypothetical protein SAMN05428642_101610 [Flaviramulus basaltis]